MTSRTLDWSTSDWQTPYFERHGKLPTRRQLPDGYVSDCMAAAIEEERRRLQHEAAVEYETREHIKALAERERLDMLRELCAEFGAAAVEKILHITLPDELRSDHGDS